MRSRIRVPIGAVILAILILGNPSPGCAQSAYNWKLDVNASNGRADTTAPGFLRWDLIGDYTDSTRRTALRSFTNSITDESGSNVVLGVITCALSQTQPAAADSTIYLNANWLNKNGSSTSTDPNAGYRLSFDGAWVHQKDNVSIDRPYTNGALSLSIAGLPDGPHTFTTYHNNIWGTNYGPISGCIVSVNGTVITNIAPSVQVTNDGYCGSAFFQWTVSGGAPVVIRFDPDGSQAFNTVILNGFEIDRPSAPGTVATSPYPVDGDEHVFAANDAPLPGTSASGTLALGWQRTVRAVSHDVYFGTTSNAVAAADHSSPCFLGNQAVTNRLMSNLDSALTYYWRVDEVTPDTIYRGNVWRFRTRHLAFPGAEGYGRFARGGRGGVVLEVTNLLDYDSTLGEAVIPGSYRAAIEATGPRTIVFRVSGLIRLKRPCTLNADNGTVTIAGQTAPGDGICLANWRAGVTSCSDVIIRYLRCRLGDASQQAMDGMGLGNANHAIMDHCSISWTIDEGTSSRQSGPVGSSSANITFQRNIISEALQHSYHYNASNRTNYEQHAFAGSISGEIGSYHHNLLAHCTDRNWSLAGGLDQSSHYAGSLDIRNNVVYNWIGRTTDGGVMRCNYVSNYYKPYPANPYAKWLLKLDPITVAWGIPTYFFQGNVMEGKDYESNNWATAFQNGATFTNIVRTNSEIFPSYVTTQTARDAYRIVLSDVGANRPQPDAIDRRIIQEVLTGTTHYKGTNGPNYTINGVPQAGSPNYAGIIDSPNDVRDATNSPNAPWPAYAADFPDADSDHDGLPDWWERLHGTDPNSASGDFSDSNADPDGDGYTNLEDYLNWLASIHARCFQDRALDIDLADYARGLTNPVFSAASALHGTVTMNPDGHTARFVPDAGYTGTAGFGFTATDGLVLSNAVSIMVVPGVAQFREMLVPAAGELALIAYGTPNTTFYLQAATNPVAGAWQVLETNQFDSAGQWGWKNLSAPTPPVFFRLQLK
ncbi:MAG: Ig-like domain-containing protein [Verrucomicrobiota bacterium]